MKAQYVHDLSNGRIRTAWDTILAETVDANAQLTPPWLSSCWDVSKDESKLSFITVEDAGKVVGVAPLMVTNVVNKAGLSIRKLVFIGDGLTDYHDLLAFNATREEILRTLMRFIVDNQGDWDAVHLRNLRGDSPNLPILRQILADTSFRVVERINIRSPFISIDGSWEAYSKTLGKNINSDIRRRLNRLARSGHSEFVRFHEVDDAVDTLDIIRAIHIKCRRAHGESSWYLDERRFRLALLVVKRFSDRKWLDLVFLKLNGKVIAYYLGFLYENIVYFWNTGYDPEFSHLSPGKLLLHYWIKDSFARGYRAFDFMVGQESYKLQWTSQTRPNYELFLFKHTARSHVLKCYYTCKPILKRNRHLRRLAGGIKSRVKSESS